MKQLTNILIVGYPRDKASYQAHQCIYQFLKKHGLKPYLDANLADQLSSLPREVFLDLKGLEALKEEANTLSSQSRAKPNSATFPQIDLVIVVGGDGNMLRAAVQLAHLEVPLIGVNKGNLGFLTDIDPDKIESALSKILLQEEYDIEERDILEILVLTKEGQVHQQFSVFNELAITGTLDHRIVEMEVFVNKKFAFGMLGDGLLIATPTGSTAYNLSAVGPIVHPSLSAMIINPLNPHTLTSRPIVIPTDAEIEVHFKGNSLSNTATLYLDGQLADLDTIDTKVIVRTAKPRVKLLHCKDYNYYRILAKKLGWASRLFEAKDHDKVGENKDL